MNKQSLGEILADVDRMLRTPRKPSSEVPTSYITEGLSTPREESLGLIYWGRDPFTNNLKNIQRLANLEREAKARKEQE